MATRLLTLRQVAEYLNVHPATVRRLVRTGQLQAIRVGRDLRFDAKVVETWTAAGGTVRKVPKRTTEDEKPKDGKNAPIKY